MVFSKERSAPLPFPPSFALLFFFSGTRRGASIRIFDMLHAIYPTAATNHLGRSNAPFVHYSRYDLDKSNRMRTRWRTSLVIRSAAQSTLQPHALRYMATISSQALCDITTLIVPPSPRRRLPLACEFTDFCPSVPMAAWSTSESMFNLRSACFY